MHHFVVKFSIFFASGGKGALTPNQNPAEALGVGAVFQNTFYVFFRFQQRVLRFLPRNAMLAWYVLWPCACLSVRLSQAGIVSKRLDEARWFGQQARPSTSPVDRHHNRLAVTKF